MAVDDDVDLLRLIEKILSKNHYQVDTKLDVADLTAEKINQYHLLILDVMMPQMSGFEFLREYRQQIDIPVLFLTAKNFEKDKVEGFASGGDDYLVKPFSIEEFRARIEAHLRRERREKTQRIYDGLLSIDLIQFKKNCGLGNKRLN